MPRTWRGTWRPKIPSWWRERVGPQAKNMTSARGLRRLHVYIYIYIYMWQRLKNIGLVTGPGGLFATRLVTESGGVAINPPCDKPIEDYSTLHRGPRQGFVTGVPRQKVCSRGGRGGSRQTPNFESQPYMSHIWRNSLY